MCAANSWFWERRTCWKKRSRYTLYCSYPRNFYNLFPISYKFYRTFFTMSDWDTAPITLRKRAPKAAVLKSEQAVNAARRQGFAVETQAKWGGGANKQHVTTKNTAKLDRETEELKHDKIPLDVGKLIQQGRQGKGMSQKDLATKVNEKAQVINDYEAGRGIPNQMVIGKIERVLGIKLRGKDRGKPLMPPGTKK